MTEDQKANLSLGAIGIFMFALIVFLFFIPFPPSYGQHHHPLQDAPIHERFYKTWMMPDNRSISCCHERDCYPTEARKTLSGWIAKRREDGQWLSVPDRKIERDLDNPDGRNHLCAPPPGAGDTVFCFILGGST